MNDTDTHEPTDVNQLPARVIELEQALRGLLLSADIAWESNPYRYGGHDWAEACRRARQVLGFDPRADGYY